jgi:5-methylcytosine-specific restriction endonuclease McrA
MAVIDLRDMQRLPIWFRKGIMRALNPNASAKVKARPNPEWFRWSKEERRAAGMDESFLHRSERINRGRSLSSRWYGADPCVWCYRTLSPHERTAEHVIPISSKPKDEPALLVMACEECNRTRSNRPLLHHILMTMDRR